MGKFSRKTGIKLTVESGEDYLKIWGRCPLKSGTIDSANDHRIAMSLTVISSVFGGVIENAECVNKSYPLFFEDCEQLGIKIFKNGSVLK